MSGSGSRTRPRSDPARARLLRETRVSHVVDLMTKGKWEGAKSHRALAKKWECSVGAVADYAREASGIIRHAVSGDLETIRTAILTGIDEVRRTAMRLKKVQRTGVESYEVLDAPDCKAALAAYELQARMLGIDAPEDRKPSASSTSVTVVNAPQAAAAGTPQFASARELREYIENEVLPRVREREAAEESRLLDENGEQG